MKREIEALRSDQSKLVLEKEAMSNKISSLEVEFNELRSNFSEVKYLADQRRKILESTLERLSMKATAEDKEEKARKEWEAEHNKLQAHLAIVALPPVGPCIHAKGGAAGGATDIAIEHEPELPEIVPFKNEKGTMIAITASFMGRKRRRNVDEPVENDMNEPERKSQNESGSWLGKIFGK
mmetsp:Transcript_25315/g.83686  ORF Transcript_25315/g.83686 Transcript_25315/m.83686 type:complete len:181 (+) Transcript_25315:1437-1979(+)